MAQAILDRLVLFLKEFKATIEQINEPSSCITDQHLEQLGLNIADFTILLRQHTADATRQTANLEDQAQKVSNGTVLGGVVGFAGIVLAPVTAGLSLPLAVAGFGGAAYGAVQTHSLNSQLENADTLQTSLIEVDSRLADLSNAATQGTLLARIESLILYINSL